MKKRNLYNPVTRLRIIGILEGLSFIFLLVVAMPLKYLADSPGAITIPGWIHGILFMLYLAVLFQTAYVRRWGWKKIVLGVLASVFPFGPFLLEPRLRKEELEMNNAS